MTQTYLWYLLGYIVIGHWLALTFSSRPIKKYLRVQSRAWRIIICEILAFLWLPIIALGICLICLYAPIRIIIELMALPIQAYCKYIIDGNNQELSKSE